MNAPRSCFVTLPASGTRFARMHVIVGQVPLLDSAISQYAVFRNACRASSSTPSLQTNKSQPISTKFSTCLRSDFDSARNASTIPADVMFNLVSNWGSCAQSLRPRLELNPALLFLSSQDECGFLQEPNL